MSVEMNCINDVVEMIFLLLTAFKVISAYLTLELANYQKADDKIYDCKFLKKLIPSDNILRIQD